MDAATPARPKTQSSRALLLLLMVLTGTGPLALNILVPAAPQLASEFKADIGTVQLTLSLFLLSFAFSQLVLGPLSDKFGRRPVLLGGLALAAVVSFAAIAATSIGWLIVARVLQALGASTGMVIGRAIVRDLYDRDRAAAMIGLVTTVMVLVPMFAPALGGVLDTAFGWEAIFLVLGVFYTGVLLWTARALPETRVLSGNAESIVRDWKVLLKNRRFYGYTLCGAFGTAQFFLFIGGAPHITISMMGRSSAEYGLWFMVTSTGYMVGNFVTSRLSERLGVHKMIIMGLGVQFTAVLIETIGIALYGAASPALLFVPRVLMSFGNGILLANAVAGAVSLVPNAIGAASGIAGFTQFIVGAACAQLISVIIASAATPLPLPLLTMAAILTSAAAYVVLVRRRDVN